MSTGKNIDIEKLTPLLKWAGGKRWFLPYISKFVPKKINNYFEPFFGSGAVFFHLQPKTSVLSDLNSELIEFYRAIRDRPDLVMRYLRHHAMSHSAEHYYNVRNVIPKTRYASAARFLYLNRTCWNGLYRVNKKGLFNVPIGTKQNVILQSDDFERMAMALANSELVCSDFEDLIERAGEDDFVFIDPPYTTAHNLNGFVKYNEKIFTWNDQIRLAHAVDRAVLRGAKVLITNACHKSVRDLYPSYDQTVISRNGIISGAVHGRGKFEEVVIQCY